MSEYRVVNTKGEFRVQKYFAGRSILWGLFWGPGWYTQSITDVVGGVGCWDWVMNGDTPCKYDSMESAQQEIEKLKQKDSPNIEVVG